MLWLVAALYVLAGVLPLVALGTAWRTASQRFRTLDEDLLRIEAVMAEGGSFDEMQAIRPTRLRAGTIGWAPDLAERTLYAELRRPAVLAAVGILAGATGSLLDLFLLSGADASNLP